MNKPLLIAALSLNTACGAARPSATGAQEDPSKSLNPAYLAISEKVKAAGGLLKTVQPNGTEKYTTCAPHNPKFARHADIAGAILGIQSTQAVIKEVCGEVGNNLKCNSSCQDELGNTSSAVSPARTIFSTVVPSSENNGRCIEFSEPTITCADKK